MSHFVEGLHDVFARFGAVTTRRMFGGHGVFHEGLIFALVADDVLYLKADDASADAFHRLGLGPFLYDKAGKTMAMSYYLAPEGILDDPEEARAWAVLAFEAALRAKKPPLDAKAKERG